MDARAAAAPAVFAALGKECGIVLRRAELIPAMPVTATFRNRPVEEAVAELVRLTGIPSTLSAVSAKEPMTLYFLPTGTGTMPTAPQGAVVSGPGAAGQGASSSGGGASGPGGAGSGAAGAAAKPKADPAKLLADITALDGDQGFVVKGLDLPSLLDSRDDAAREEALQRYLAATTDQERAAALADLNALGLAAGMKQPWDAESVTDERWRLSWQKARSDYLLAGDDASRAAALGQLQKLNPDEAQFLLSLDEKKLADAKTLAAVNQLKSSYFLSRTKEEWQRWFAEKNKGASGPAGQGRQPAP
jgi:hypothetical protein